jgi:ribosome-associated protein
LRLITASLDDDKAENVVVVDLEGKASFADYMVIATGRSDRQVGAMADHLVQKLKAEGIQRVPAEGMAQRDWVLLDSGDVVVHLFRPEVRSFYNLEKLWSDEPAQARVAERIA